MTLPADSTAPAGPAPDRTAVNGLLPWIRAAGPAGAAERPRARRAAVLFDRDGTLVHDVPYNGDPAAVRPVTGAADAVAALRSAGILVGVVSNQSGVARGLLTRGQVDAVNRRIEALLGPMDVWAVCPHGPEDGCGCRKPAPGLVLAACRVLAVPPRRAVVIGDIGSDGAAAEAAGAFPVLVPNPATRAEETAAARTVASDLAAAVRAALGHLLPAGRPA
ncbi:HAD-IIIA family hydrolase [Kitasatospora purpeofusca]|uniref:D-glycero-alpha-D-manno-heptose-1,7-bisphosphate 7-phosphatase n=1 Tax=Kitasatospora purpeofusca TaxID=67352 RepID=UPI002A59D677|nr:HAD-IIIA family hydrolase [Kitasatospora purpeofusca]MDY0814535.1 HAD-IIIA family hydrolase [Kitasatospora purpeofusca]